MGYEIFMGFSISITEGNKEQKAYQSIYNASYNEDISCIMVLHLDVSWQLPEGESYISRLAVHFLLI